MYGFYGIAGKLKNDSDRFLLKVGVAVIITAVMLISAKNSLAGQVTLTWNAPTTNADGTPISYFSGAYRIYYGTASGNYSQVTNLNNSNGIVTQQVPNLTDGQLYSFVVTAVNTLGNESGYSNEISKTVQSETSTTYTITASAGANGTISPSGATTVNSGASQAYSITPGTGYHVAGVFVDGSPVGTVTSYTFSNVTANHTISATFAINSYTITASAGANGTISPSGATTVNSGASQAYSITPGTGYHVAGVFVDGSPVGTVTSYTFSNVTANHTISATFAINSYTITASAGANGTISPSGATTVNSGASQVYSITPGTGYHVAGVFVDGSPVGTVTSYTFSNVTANHTISATFAINSYTITASAGANGTISPSGATTVNSGASQVYSITPGTGYHVAGVFVDGSPVGTVTSYTFSNVTANHTISATFAINSYTITASAGANGTISPSGATTVNSGASQVYSITPGTGYHVAGVFVDGSPVGTVTSYTFSNVTANHTISATFAINSYTITASAGTNGTITPSGAKTVDSGTSQAYSITPGTGYHVRNVLVDGSSVGAVTTYTFSGVTANHTISAFFGYGVAERHVCLEGCQYGTIQQAVSEASSDDTIKVAKGVYNENIVIKAGKTLVIQGGWNSGFTSMSADPSVTVINGDITGDGNGDGSVMIIKAGPAANIFVSIENMTLTNGDAGNGGGVRVLSSANTVGLVLKNTVLSGNTAGTGGGLSAISSNSGHISVSLVNAVIAENVAAKGGAVYAYSEDAGSTTKMMVTNGTVTSNEANKGGGLYIWSADSGQTTMKAGNAVIWGNTAVVSGDDIFLDRDKSVTMLKTSYSDIGEVEANTVSYAAGPGDIESEPAFVNPAAGDYNLDSDSPCRDSGSSAGVPDHDLFGVSRPQGAGYDMGAEEGM